MSITRGGTVTAQQDFPRTQGTCGGFTIINVAPETGFDIP
ncbi:hypothetical protein SDC9_162805 [bioreactor metagenome]|uniref:Uncharacterized protein n=1 Tax=bioreactor metagenome TaxID=1076179 RepID=A0A645FM49_9ZZZZ